MNETPPLAQLDHAHVWHPFTPMQQWREQMPIIIERGEGFELIDTEGKRYIDGVSSLWCNVHGHAVPEIDNAIRQQLDKIAHTTLLGLASPPSIELAAKLCQTTPGSLNKVFYSDAGATAVEVAFKMAVGYWYHLGKPQKRKFIGLREAYHGDTTGAMSVGYNDLFHQPFVSMVFEVKSFAHPDACRAPQSIRSSQTTATNIWPSEDEPLAQALTEHCLNDLERLLEENADDTAAVVIEPVMQGAAGMICQPPGFVKGVADLAKKYDVLLIADEVAVGFGRTGTMFACEQDDVTPNIMCLAKGITGGYLPLAATLTTDAVEQAFCGDLSERKTLYHGHTYTGNPLACTAALASLDLLSPLLPHTQQSAALIANKLNALRDHPHVLDIRQRGLMVGIELCDNRKTQVPFDFSKRTGAALCAACRSQGLIIRPLGDVLVLMPAPAMDHPTLEYMLNIVIETLRGWKFTA